MKTFPLKILLPLMLVLSAGGVFAQTNKNIPGAADYAAFNRFVTERNIFDPNRQPHYSTGPARTVARTRTRSNSAPTVALVGTMAYEKGRFAFFSSNDAEQKKVLQVSEKIAGYRIVEILPASVTLEAADKKQTSMKVGDVLRQENGGWRLAGQGEVPAGAVPGGAGKSADSTEGKPSAAAGEPNDVLKRLMQKREQEK